MGSEPLPILLIQNDWNSILRDVGAEAWITCKSKDSPGIHGKIRTVRSLPESPAVSVSDGFQVEKVTSTTITVKHQHSPYSTVFVAPHRTFSGVHKGSIGSIDVNNDSLAVSFSSQGDMVVWDTRTEEIKLKLEGHVFEVYKCGFFPSGKVVLSCGSDMTLRIWCARTGKCPVVLKGHTMAVTDFAYIGKGRNVISTSKDGKVKLWNCGDASCIAEVASVSSSINCCCVIEDPSYINLPQDLPEQQPRNAREVETENKLVIFGAEDGTVEGVALGSRQNIFTFIASTAVNCISAIGGEHFVYGCQNGQIFLCSFKNIREKKEWHESNSAVLSILPFRNLGFFASRADGSVDFISLKDNQKRISLTGPNFDPVYDMATDGKHIYTCSRDASVRMYIVENIMNDIF